MTEDARARAQRDELLRLKLGALVGADFVVGFVLAFVVGGPVFILYSLGRVGDLAALGAEAMVRRRPFQFARPGERAGALHLGLFLYAPLALTTALIATGVGGVELAWPRALLAPAALLILARLYDRLRRAGAELDALAVWPPLGAALLACLAVASGVFSTLGCAALAAAYGARAYALLRGAWGGQRRG